MISVRDLRSTSDKSACMYELFQAFPTLIQREKQGISIVTLAHKQLGHSNGGVCNMKKTRKKKSFK